MVRSILLVIASLCVFTSEVAGKCDLPTEAQQIAKVADKVSRQGNELIFRLRDGRTVSKKSAPKGWDGSSDCDGNTNIAYTFYDFIDPWYVVQEGYYESHGTLFINRDTGAESEVAGYSRFSPDNAHFLAEGYPGEGDTDMEIWEVTPERIVREWVLQGGVSYNFRWIGPSVIEIAEHDQTIARMQYTGGAWKCSGARRICKALEFVRDSDQSEEALANEKRNRWREERDPATGEVIWMEQVPKKELEENTEEAESEPTVVSAAQEGDLEIVKSFLDAGSNIEAIDENGRTALEAAAEIGHGDVVKLLLAKGARVNAKDHLNPPLMLAATRGDAKMVKMLLDHGADANAVGAGGRTPLMAAVWHDHFDVVRLLLEKGANANTRDDHCSTALIGPFNLSWRIEPKILKLLVDKGADVNAEDEQGQFALRQAAYRGDLEVMELLLANGAGVNAKNKENWTALMEAAFRGRSDAVRLLLERGADVNMKYLKGKKALHCVYNHRDVGEILLESRSSIDLRDEDGMTALMEAARGKYLQVVKRLLERGADVNAKDKHGWNALTWAVQQGHMEEAAVLKERGSAMTLMAAACLGDLRGVQHFTRDGHDINARGGNGRTPLMGSAGHGHTAIVKFLQDNRAEPNARDEDGSTSLMAAAVKGHLAVVKLLLEKGVDVNARNDEDQTPLINAVAGGHVQIVKVLLDHGANVNTRGPYCRTALDLAREGTPHKEIVGLLKAHGAKD